MAEPTICIICEQEASFSWTDTHGIAQCWNCGAPYRLYHYENDKRVDKPPECIVRAEWLPLLKKYRAETGKIIPGGHSFPGGQERASNADITAFDDWCDAHKAELPPPISRTPPAALEA